VSAPSSLAIIFWLCLAAVVFAYLGYPLLIHLLSQLFGRHHARPSVADAELPVVSLLIAAHNEALDIEERILNALALDYPTGKLEIVIASDGSTDGTNDIVRRYADRGVQLFAYERNRGKATVLNETVPRLRGSVILLSDANTNMAPDVARRLASWFVEPEVGVVCGRLVLTDPHTGRNVDGLYWQYETFLKKRESRLGALLGSNGAIYAIRRELFPAVEPGTLIDDFVIPLEAKRASGCRIVYDTGAIATEETAPTIRAEFRRRVRIGAGGFQSICMLWPLLSPANGWVALTFFCHKILRWVCPFLLGTMLIASGLLIANPLYAWLFAAQCAFYALSFIGHWLPAQPRFLRYFRLPAMFTSMNLALFLGFVRWIRGGHTGVWTRTDRVGDVDGAVSGSNPDLLRAIGAE
jgi:cellulose synthase/poly-beta-1,6-N-acetylglucosamine synthase-like glycosyltransferase